MDVLISYSIARGKLKADITNDRLRELTRLDKSALSKALEYLRDAGVIRLTSNLDRAARARMGVGDCPTVEISLDSAEWFKAIPRNRKGGAWIEPERGKLIRSELCAQNPVQTDLAVACLPEALRQASQDSKQAQLVEAAKAETSGPVTKDALAGCEGAIGEASIGRQPGGRPAPDDPFGGDPVGFHTRLRALGAKRLAEWVTDNPEIAERLGREVAVVFKTTPPRLDPAVVFKTTAPETPNEPVNKGESAPKAAVVFKTTASPPYKAYEVCTPPMPSRREESEAGTAETRPTIPQPIKSRATEFILRLAELCRAARDEQTMKNWGTWWRSAFLVNPTAAELALDFVKDSLGTCGVANVGGLGRKKYWEFGGDWIGRRHATPEQRERLMTLGVTFYATPYVKNLKRKGK